MFQNLQPTRKNQSDFELPTIIQQIPPPANDLLPLTISTVRPESRCALRLRYVDLIVSIEVFYKCTVTFRTYCIIRQTNYIDPVY